MTLDFSDYPIRQTHLLLTEYFIQHSSDYINKRNFAITPLNKSGRMFTTAPINKPPALPPDAKSFWELYIFHQSGIQHNQ
jgi:hypothetical protein